jgi:GNAT superfamily N-acetyltransferase
MLTVRPALQNARLGRVLIDAAEAHARDFGADLMEMTVIDSRQELIDWYLRRGYALTGRTAPFPADDPRFGLPKVSSLRFVILAKALR